MGPDVELREAASASGPVCHFLRSRRCPRFSDAAPPTGASRACGDPIEKPRPEVNSDRGKVLPIGQNAWTARARRPICDGAPTWSCGRRRPHRGPFVIFLEVALPQVLGCAPPTGASRACGDPIESVSGPVCHFLRSRRCPRFSDAAPPTGASRACGDPIEKPRPEVNSVRGKVLPSGKTLGRRMRAAPSAMGPRRGAAGGGVRIGARLSFS